MSDKIHHIVQHRTYHPTFTESELFVPWSDERFCWILEDQGRPVNVKFPGETCIPEGIYEVGYSVSQRFGKEMIQLTGIGRKDFVLSKDGVSFSGVRVHGGNDVDDSHGCPLANFNTDHKGKQWGRASDELLSDIKYEIGRGKKVRWVITS